MKYRNTFTFKVLMLTAAVFGMIAVQRLMLVHLAGGNTVSRIFAAGPHVDGGTLATALTFIAVRLTTFLVLPGIAVSRLGWLYVEHLARRRTQAETAAEKGTSR